MKILHVLTSPRAEGTPRLVLDWLTINKYEQEILFLSASGELKEEFIQSNVWQFYNSDFKLGFTSAIKIIRLVKKICDERKPDLVISWPMGFSQWVHLGARMAGVRKLLVHAGNPPGQSWMARYTYSYLSFWIGYMVGNKVVACSKYIKEEFDKIPFLSASQFYWVYNCIRVSKFIDTSDISRKHDQAIMVATLEKHKDHETLLRAWQQLEKKNLKYTLIIAGAGSLEKKLHELTAALGLTQVRFVGSRSDIPLLLHSSGLFVLSTTPREGFGTVLIEALASGCKVVATDVRACHEVLQGGQYGALVPPANPEALAEEIIHSYESPLTDDQLAEQISYASGFTPEKMIEEYITIASYDERKIG
jgi:glycosyltransferase involved in cell wall biosynthesis